MINNNISNIPNFVSQANLLIPIMHNRLSGDPTKKIILSKPRSASKQLIIPIEEADENCITLEDFLFMLDIRINAEVSYRDEITQLKSDICEAFNNLCNEVADEGFIKFVREQRQRVINAIIDETKIEQKMIADQFFNEMMNGWEENALDLEHFESNAYSVLWKPLLTPLPIEALNKLKEFIGELGEDKSAIKIEKMTTHLINHIKLHMQAVVVKDSDFKDTEELMILLEKIIKKRQNCKIEISYATKNISIVTKLESKCIETITLIISADEFIEKELKFNYDELELDGNIDETNVETFSNKIQKTIRLLDFSMSGSAAYNEAKKIFSKLKYLENLKWNLSFSKIKEEEAKSLLAALNELKNISTLNLDLSFNNIGEKEITVISVALKELKNVSTLDLNLGCNEIGEEGAKAVSTALKELKNISILNLNLMNNSIREEGVKAVSAALKELKNISTLSLNLAGNNIGGGGVIAVSATLGELKNILTLNLNLQFNNIGEIEAKAVSTALKELKNISTLSLDFMDNNIGEEGVKAVSAALQELENISILNLNFQSNNIGGNGAIVISATLKELKNISTLNFNLELNNIGEKGAVALEQLKLINPKYSISYLAELY